MTIAACYLSEEGVVFGADSTATFTMTTGSQIIHRHYNFAQKIFQIGQISTLGVVTWGLDGLPNRSLRTLIAEFADQLRYNARLPDMNAVAHRWSTFFWELYSQANPTDFD